MGSKKKEILEEMNHFDDDIDAYMGNDDILEYLPKSAELDEPDLFKLSGEGDIDENDRLPDLPKFLNKNNNIPLDSTMTTDHTLDNNEQEFDEDELIIIKDLEKKSQQKDRKERERYEAKNPDEYEPEQEEEHNDYHDDPDHNDEEEELAEPKPSAERDIPQNKKDKDKQATNTKGKTGDSQNSLSSTARLYQHEVAKPKFNAGKKQISISEAKLFGLLDEKGEFIDLKSTQKVLTADEKFQLKRYYNEMSAPKPESTEEELNTEELTFKPMKSQDALKAMKNPHCGYDFMDRLNTRGNFLDRVNQLAGGGGGGKNGKESKISKTEYDRMKQDYDSLLNKLQCPKCLKFQSFDEFINKKRLCTLCNQKFTKLHLSSGLSFTKKNEEYERKRLEKLEKIDREMYGNIPPKTMKPPAAANHSNTASLLNNPRINETQSALPNHPRPVSASNAHNKTQTINKSSNKPQNNLFPNKTTLITPAALSKANNNYNNNTQQQQPAAESKIDQRDAIKKIMAINNQNAMKAFETLQRFDTPAEEKGSTSRGADKKKSLPPRPTSAAATPKNKMAKDMERLLNP